MRVGQSPCSRAEGWVDEENVYLKSYWEFVIQDGQYLIVKDPDQQITNLPDDTFENEDEYSNQINVKVYINMAAV